MAQDAELKLKVSLDLGFFRQQLAGLGQAAAGYNIPVQVKFDRRSVQNELNALGANIRRRNYFLEVKTNLSKEIDNAKKLADALRALESGKTAGGATSARGTFRQNLGKVDTGTIRNIYAAAAKEGILAFSEETNKSKSALITALNKAAQDAGQGFLNAFSAQNSAIRKAAGDYGDALLSGLRKTLRSQSPSREMFDIGEDAGKGFELGLLRSMELAEQSATRKMRRMLDRLARVALMASGMSVAEINRQAGQFQGGASVAAPSWASTVPPSQGGGGGGRLLPPGPTFAALGGTAFGSQKYLPTDLSAELKQILRGAAFAFVDAIRTETRSVRIGVGASMQAALPASRIAGLLSAGVGRTPSRYATGTIGGETREQMLARRTQEAYTRSGLRSIDIMGGGAGRQPSPYSYAYKPISRAIVPYQSPGALVATGGGGGAQPPQGPSGGGFGGFGQFGRAMGGVSLPGAGTIRELGTEFSFAAKQVLLFGTAYKALAFIQAFPGEVGQAVGQLQSFRNTLNAISPSAQEAAASNKLILDLVDKYNIPLQSARDGFTKLYASMAPAGFQGEEIRQLFTGISQAAATFGMSADKVDRVNYAFAQMASKGQVMSEELKGQLGDVLPGAMAIFAEAAGFKGPKAIQDFSAALEEGRYKGEAMVGLLKNVGIVMTQEFGPGAEGAARTFQGVINRMQNSFKLLYEAFEPAAVGFLNGVVTPMTQGIRQVADGVNSFFTGAQTRTAGGSALAKELERLRPTFDGIRNNLSALIQQFSSFGKIALEISKILLQIAGNPVVGYLLRIYAIVLPLNMALGVMRGLWISNAAQLLIFNARVLTGTTTLSAFRGMMSATGTTAQTTAAAIRGAGLTLRTFFASTGIGLVLVGISMLIERFMSLNQRLEETKTKALFAAQAIRGMSASEAKAEVLSRTRVLKTLQGLQQQKTPYGGAPGVTPGQVQQLETAGVPVEGGLVPGGRRFIRRENLGGLIQQQKQLLGEALSRQQQLALEEQQLKTPPALPSIPGGEGGEGSTRKIKEYYRDISDSLSDIGQKEKDNLQSLHLAGQITERQYDLGLAAIELETSKKIAAEQLRVALARLNDENLSAGDKVLKQKDLQIKYQNTLALAQNKYNLTVQKSVADLEKPIAEGIRDEALAIAKAETQIKAYRQGRLQLTAAEEAAIIVSEKFKDLDEEELGLMADKIKEYEEIIALRIENNRLLEQEGELTRAKSEIEAMGTGLMAGFYGSAAQVYESQLAQGKPEGHARQMAELETQSMRLQATFGGIQNAIGGISSAFGSLMTEGIASMVQGTATAQEVFSQFLNTIGQALMQAASQMIATYVAIGIARIFAGMGGGGGGYAQGNVSTDAFTSGGIPGLSNTASVSGSSFGGFTGGSFGVGKFANGGIVSGPTLGLIGEGKYNEAIVPLPDGRAIPVQMQGDSVRDKMNGSGNGGAAASPMLSMNFETTTINNVEYVSREQLEKAMMETRKLATRDGARQGANLAIDKIQQSPNTRRRIGI